MQVNSDIKFSIIVPTYNRAWCIERAITSIMRQSYTDWEMIIVDDGSTDDTKNIIEKYLSDSRIKYFYKENGGVGSARNFGIENMNGKVIMFLDSDDELILEVLDLISSSVSKYKDEKIFAFRAVDQNGLQISYTDKICGNQLIGFTDFVSEKYIKGEAFLAFKKEVFYGNTFDEDVNGGEGLLVFKLIQENRLMVINEDARIYHKESPDSLISSKLTYARMRNVCKIQMRMIEKYENDLKENNRRYLGTLYLVSARALALSGKKILSTKYFLFGCYYSILDFKRIFLYVVSLFDYNLKINNILNSFYNRRLL